ncbi:DHHA1 domain-containing protein [Halococcus sediminicola]|uniref:DHHA1 domain-containing protein n=1 Tax=Halococcus sediminicola TaxID=1264579 RepID=UPI0006789F71|nr:DHHA1 domain-containing protein [Halococcus sediminicola]
MNEKLLTIASGIALAGTSLYWRRRERIVTKSLTATRDWEANATGETDRAVGRAAREAADHLDAGVEDLPERVRAVDEERRDLRRELDTVRERWADALWRARSDTDAGDADDGGRGDPSVFVVEFEHGELPDARAFAKRAIEDEAITLVAAHGDDSFAVAVGEELSEVFSAEDIADELADEVGGGAGGTDRLAAGGGATGALGDGCRRVRERLFQSDAVHAA